MWARRIFLVMLIAMTSLLPLAITTAAEPEIYANSVTGIAINGYDPVAYFTEGQPVKGSAEFEVMWKGAPWHFSSAETRDMFLANPEHYAPQYGGYCAFAMSQGALATTVPEAWTVHNDKLYLNYSQGVRGLWRQKPDELIELANGFWPKVLETGILQ